MNGCMADPRECFTGPRPWPAGDETIRFRLELSGKNCNGYLSTRLVSVGLQVRIVAVSSSKARKRRCLQPVEVLQHEIRRHGLA